MVRFIGIVSFLLLKFWVPLGAQHVKWLADEHLSEFGIHATVHTIEPPAGQLPIGNVFNAWFDAEGAVWLTSENGLYRWDGISLERLPTSDPSFEGYRPYGIFPLYDGTLILTFTSALLPKSNIQALALIRPGSKSIEPFPMPLEAGDPKWSLHRSGSGIFLIEHSGTVFVLEMKPFRWRKVGKVQGIPDRAERMARTAQGVLTWTTRENGIEEYAWVSNGSAKVILQNVHPLRIPLAGRFDLFQNIALEKDKPLTLVSIDPLTGGVERKVFESMGPFGNFISFVFPLVFLTENTNELWGFDKKRGRLIAADLNSGKITRSFGVAGILDNHQPTCIITRGGDIIVGTSSGLVWIHTSRLVLQQQLQEVGSVRTFHADGDRLLWGTYSGNYLSSLPKGGSFPSFPTLKKLDQLRGTVMHFHQEADGSFWGGNSAEMFHFELGKGILDQIPIETGDLWRFERWGKFFTLGTDAGIRQYDPSSSSMLASPQSTPPFADMRVHGFVTMENGERLAYGENGFYRLQLHGDSILGARPFLPITNDLAVFHVYMESPRLWWLCTKSGLFAVDPVRQEFKHRGMLLLLSGVPSYGILPDHQGHLWVSTREGLVRIDASRQNLYRFGLRDGLSQLEFNRNAFLKLDDGRMLFGGILGAVVVDPRVTKPPRLPFADSFSVVLRSGGELLVQKIGQEERTYVLPENASSVRLELRGLFLPCPDCRYAWRIDSEGEQWHFGQGSAMEISDLPTGDFLLEAWKEIEGHWVRLPNIQVQRSGATLSMQWLTVAGIYLFFIFLLALVGFVYRSQQLPLPAEPEETGVPSTGQVATEEEELSAARNWADHFETVLAEHYHDPELKVGKMAAMMSVSERHLLRICREHTGMSPNEFLLDFRLRRAREEIMKNPLAQIAEVAYRSGFQTPTYFSRCFAEKFGKLPSKLQKEVLSGR